MGDHLEAHSFAYKTYCAGRDCRHFIKQLHDITPMPVKDGKATDEVAKLKADRDQAEREEAEAIKAEADARKNMEEAAEALDLDSKSDLVDLDAPKTDL